MSELETEFFRILTNNPDYFQVDNLVFTFLRWIAWSIVKFLMYLADQFQKTILELWRLPEFLQSEQMEGLVGMLSVTTYMIATLSLIFYAIRRMVTPDLKNKSFIDSLLLGLGTALLSTIIIGEVLTKSTLIFQELYNGEDKGSSFVYQIINDTGKDTLRGLRSGFNPEDSKIVLSKDNIQFFDYGQVLNENYVTQDRLANASDDELLDLYLADDRIGFNQALEAFKDDAFKIFNYRVEIAPSGDLALVEGHKLSWLGIPQSYYRYNIDIVLVIGYLITYLIAIGVSMLKFIKLFFEIFFNNTILPLFLFSDFNGAKGLRAILNNIKNAFLVMFLCGLTLKVFTVLQYWIIDQDFNTFTMIVLQIGLGIAVVDGATIAQELTGYDAGLKSMGAMTLGVGAATVGATVGATKLTGKGLGVGFKLGKGGAKMIGNQMDKYYNGGSGTGQDNSTEAKDKYVQEQTQANASTNRGINQELQSNPPIEKTIQKSSPISTIPTNANPEIREASNPQKSSSGDNKPTIPTPTDGGNSKGSSQSKQKDAITYPQPPQTKAHEQMAINADKMKSNTNQQINKETDSHLKQSLSNKQELTNTNQKQSIERNQENSKKESSTKTQAEIKQPTSKKQIEAERTANKANDTNIPMG